MNKKANAGIFLGIFSVLFLTGIFIAVIGFDQVDASHIGVKNQMGNIQGTMNPGIQWTGLFTNVESYDLRTRTMTVDMNGNNAAVDKDGQSVLATIQINYHLKSENIIEVYSRVGKDSEIATVLNLDGIIREGFKSVTVKYTSLEIIQNRQQIKDQTLEQIHKNFPTKYFEIDNVIITNVDFNPAFKAAIEQKKTNEQLALSAQKAVEIKKFEADQQIEQTRGLTESKKLQADADAYTLLKKSESEAKALEMKKEQITTLMIQSNWIDKWDGKLVPQFNMGGNSQSLMVVDPVKIMAANYSG